MTNAFAPPPTWLGRSLERHDVATSTMELCSVAADSGAPDGHVVVARLQTAGRGRTGHAWHSADDGGLYLSLLRRGFADPVAASGLTLAVGLGVGAAVGDLAAGADVRLKWPNDVLVVERKVAGVLTQWLGRGALVVGIGLNVDQQTFPDELVGRAVSLRSVVGRPIGTEAALGVLLARLEQAFAVFQREGLAWVVPAWTARSGLWGRRATVAGVTGTLLRLDPDGALVLREDGGALRMLRAGAVELL